MCSLSDGNVLNSQSKRISRDTCSRSTMKKLSSKSLHLLRILLLFSLLLSLGNLRFHGHIELEFAGMSSSIDVPPTNAMRGSAPPLDTRSQNNNMQQVSPTQEAHTTSLVSTKTASSPEQHLRYRPGQLLFFDERALGRDRQLYLLNNTEITPIVKDLIDLADRAILEKAWSVTDKPNTSWVPSGDRHDFYSLSLSSYREAAAQGDRALALDEVQSEKYDSSRLKDFQYNTTILCLAFRLTKSDKYALNAVEKIRVWFVTHKTRMQPHMKYANMNYNMMIHQQNSSIIPNGDIVMAAASSSDCSLNIMSDLQLYFVLDAIRLLEGHFSPLQIAKLRRWLSKYYTWLQNFVLGNKSHATPGYKAAPFFDIERMAIITYLNETSKIHSYIDKATSRMHAQLNDENGRKPFEWSDDDADDAHESCEYRMLRTLQGWSIFSRMAMSVDRNRNLWNIHRDDSIHGGGMSLLCRASEYAIPFYGRRAHKCKPEGPHLHEVTAQSWWPLVYESQMHCPELRGKATHVPNWLMSSPEEGSALEALPPQSVYNMPSLFDQKYLIAPFWQLGKEFPMDLSSS